MFHQLIYYRVFHLNTLNVLIHTHKSYSEYSLSSIQQFGNEASLQLNSMNPFVIIVPCFI